MPSCMTSSQQHCPGKGKGRQDAWFLSLWTVQSKSIQEGLQSAYLCADQGFAHEARYSQYQIFYIHAAVSSWAKCKETIRFLILSVLTLISIYRDSRAHVNQARLVERKDLQNELFKYVCTLTYKLLKDSCDLLDEGQEILTFLQCFQHNRLRLPSIVSDAVLVQSCWAILNKFANIQGAKLFTCMFVFSFQAFL